MSSEIDLVRVSRFCELTGYTDDAVRGKIKRRQWPEGAVYFRAPDGAILISLSGYEAWGRGEQTEIASRQLEFIAAQERSAANHEGTRSTRRKGLA